ncbi:polysaccharide deacetylase family protein [Salisediminibacterium halotolerans]|uniref:polysaccharide deacetylase family protein n=1 Tax=Salisediminibacterium halotolerans TaxID=517425 RepID=UPI001FEB30D8|nr:polysaccharide deacetylase family protein [Salisediminibacterium halotolerans]
MFVAALSFFPDSADAASSQFVTKGNTNEKVVALTFDDGADGTNINKILNTLQEHKVKATFFLTGTGMKHHPANIKRITDQGHQIANRSYTHPYFTKLTASQMKSELDKTEALAKKVTGKSTKPIFRAPYGVSNNSVLAGVGAAGYTHTIQWNIDTVDWKGVSKTQIVNKVVNNITPGSIVLMHTGAGASGTPAVLPEMVKKLKAKGYKFVTVSELLNLKPSSAPAEKPPATSSGTYTVKTGDTFL